MSTPRRPAPRSRAAPMIVARRSACIGISDKANFPPMGNRDAATMIRVLLADDDQPFLDALSPLIERQPELAVVGVRPMPRLAGVSAGARLRRAHPSMCVIALTGDVAPALHRAVTEAGADAVLVKDEFVDVLVDRLAAARAGIL